MRSAFSSIGFQRVSAAMFCYQIEDYPNHIEKTQGVEAVARPLAFIPPTIKKDVRR